MDHPAGYALIDLENEEIENLKVEWCHKLLNDAVASVAQYRGGSRMSCPHLWHEVAETEMDSKSRFWHLTASSATLNMSALGGEADIERGRLNVC